MMGSDGTQFAAIAETTSFLHHFKDLPDHRQAGKVDYPLLEVLLLILLAGISGGGEVPHKMPVCGGGKRLCRGTPPPPRETPGKTRERASTPENILFPTSGKHTPLIP